MNDINITRYNSIDLFKFIMAFAVVAIHTDPLVSCSNVNIKDIYEIIVRLAVPFFFLASGFLLASKMRYPFHDDDAIIRVKKTRNRLVKLYLVWSLVYAPLAIYSYCASGDSVTKCIFSYVKDLLLIGEHYNSWPLWYLLSSIYALLVIQWLLCKKINVVYLFVFLLFVSGVICFLDYISVTDWQDCNGWVSVKKLVGLTILNGRIFLGWIYIPIGMYLFEKPIPIKISCCLFGLGCLLDYLNTNMFVDFYLRIMTAIGLFGIVASIHLRDSKQFEFYRGTSLYIYLIHMYVWSFYYKIVYGEKNFGLDSFIVTALVSLLLSAAYVFMKRRFSLFRDSNS